MKLSGFWASRSAATAPLSGGGNGNDRGGEARDKALAVAGKAKVPELCSRQHRCHFPHRRKPARVAGSLALKHGDENGYPSTALIFGVGTVHDDRVTAASRHSGEGRNPPSFNPLI
ncbi:hypothetical protein RCO27_04935 [Sphingosinicella sp. LHD-64]|uniref:hypothetical protein n=1 Tax=Sphingosinicella sp. LHD-64 TaxID=3072139 RepID=UPI00280CE51F|nr:hypothetical protein [Sphingosinicella sp. LHD-64]MDQ8755566.1 hypothetical protein [Sphingosinicella sp. LHD-64]